MAHAPNLIHVGQLRRARMAQGVGEINGGVGEINGIPVVMKPKAHGRYVYDAETGAIQFEHDVGPKAEAALQQVANSVKNVELSLDHLRETVASLRSPVRRTLLVVGAVILAALVAGGATYLITRRMRAARRKS